MNLDDVDEREAIIDVMERLIEMQNEPILFGPMPEKTMAIWHDRQLTNILRSAIHTAKKIRKNKTDPTFHTHYENLTLPGFSALL